MLYVIPALGACLSFVDLVVLVRTAKPKEDFILCFLPLSRLVMWVSKSSSFCIANKNPFLCLPLLLFDNHRAKISFLYSADFRHALIDAFMCLLRFQ